MNPELGENQKEMEYQVFEFENVRYVLAFDGSSYSPRDMVGTLVDTGTNLDSDDYDEGVEVIGPVYLFEQDETQQAAADTDPIGNPPTAEEVYKAYREEEN